MSEPNQKTVKIAPRVKRNADNLYAMFNIDALSEAVQNLNGSALKMWLYFNKNQDNYKIELSQAACRKWGIKKDSYYNGVKELIIKGYLAPIYEGSNIYNFYEKQKAENAEKSTSFSETYTPSSEQQINTSDLPQRNNTNNTKIIQNNTTSPFRIVGKDEYKYNFSDGSQKEQYGNNDESEERFGDQSKDIDRIAKSFGF